MSFQRFLKYKELYFFSLPVVSVYSTVSGINIGASANTEKPNDTSFAKYSNLIGYTSIGIITGLTFPISFPLFGCYVLYKNRT